MAQVLGGYSDLFGIPRTANDGIRPAATPTLLVILTFRRSDGLRRGVLSTCREIPPADDGDRQRPSSAVGVMRGVALPVATPPIGLRISIRLPAPSGRHWRSFPRHLYHFN